MVRFRSSRKERLLVTIAQQRRHRRLSPYAPLEVHQASLYTALYGAKAICSGMLQKRLQVRSGILKYESEVFGASEDEAPELDHSEDSENGESISHDVDSRW